MKKYFTKWQFYILIIPTLFTSCVSYDKAILYSKAYTIGFNNKMKLDGFYASKTETLIIPPIFFIKMARFYMVLVLKIPKKLDTLLKTIFNLVHGGIIK